MSPRRTADFAQLVETLVENIRIQVASGVNQTLGDFAKRLVRLEKRFDGLGHGDIHSHRLCNLCGRRAVARGMCSAHYQQWRYRQARTGKASRAQAIDIKSKVARNDDV